MQSRSTTYIMGLFTLLATCFGGQAKAQSLKDVRSANLEEITAHIDPEEGWNDVFFKITEESRTDTSRIYVAKGLYKGDTVGFKAEVLSSFGAGIVAGKIAQEGMVGNGIRLSSIGAESDGFVKALAELYKQDPPTGFSDIVVPVTAFSLNETAVDLDGKGKYKLKLFLGEGDDNRYAELYFNIDLGKREIELAEKDEGYRGPIIAWFSR